MIHVMGITKATTIIGITVPRGEPSQFGKDGLLRLVSCSQQMAVSIQASGEMADGLCDDSESM